MNCYLLGAWHNLNIEQTLNNWILDPSRPLFRIECDWLALKLKFFDRLKNLKE